MEVSTIFQVLQISSQIANVPSGFTPAMAHLREANLQMEAKKNFRRLSQIYHPDKGGDTEAMKSLNAAYEEIKNIRLRKQSAVMQISIHPAAVFTRKMYPDSGENLQVQSSHEGWVWQK